MNHIKTSFIKFILDCQALTFGEFILKSGRTSPYLFNAGLFYQGSSLKKLGQFYAKTLIAHNASFDNLFGPAYKGLPLATSTALALADLGKDVSVTFNRKEIKDHGEGGQLIGAPLGGKTIIIDDVITAGTAFRESQKLITQHQGNLTGVIIALDRCERGAGESSTLAEIKSQGIAVYSIINIYDLIEYLLNEQAFEQVDKLKVYQARYACSSSVK